MTSGRQPNVQSQRWYGLQQSPLPDKLQEEDTHCPATQMSDLTKRK